MVKTFTVAKGSKSPQKITNDKIVFIKTQLKSDVANFSNYGKIFLIQQSEMMLLR